MMAWQRKNKQLECALSPLFRGKVTRPDPIVWILFVALVAGCSGKVSTTDAGPDEDAGQDAGDLIDAGDPGPGDEGDPEPGDEGDPESGDEGDPGPGDEGDQGHGDDGGDFADGGGDNGDSGCVDDCPFLGGIEWGCAKRFMYGVNYAWHHFAGDFGGISPWGQLGVSGQPDTIRSELEEMKQHGVSVIRWWMFPDFRGDGIQFDGEEKPVGLAGTALADIEKALELAEEVDVYYMLCIFSFDNFSPSHDVAGIWTPGMTPMVTDAEKRAALIDKVVRPVAQAVESSPYRQRVIAWDVINEPEWAMTGPSPYGDEDYAPNGELDPVTHAQMETFVSETIAALRQESQALITVGGAAMKWANAWSQVDIDFYQFHMYAWINDWWPYDNPPSHYGVDDKPVVMGEFPMGDLDDGISYPDVITSWYAGGYAGALSWQYNEAGAAQLDLVEAFSAQHACETTY